MIEWLRLLKGFAMPPEVQMAMCWNGLPIAHSLGVSSPEESPMNIRLACPLAAAALVTVLSTQTYAKDTFKTPRTPISLIGCIQREADYRRQHGSGKGGFLGFGGGLGNEYVLINASPRRGSRDCATASGGEAYELTGSEEGDLKPFVGQRVAITGMRKAAEIDTVTGRPTGGRQAGYDLRLFEVDVESFRTLPPVQARTIARLRKPPAARESEQQVNENRIAQAPIQHRQDVGANVDPLPGTASPLPLIALVGLLSLAAGLTLRVARGRG